MSGAAIVRREAGESTVLAVHGCFDGASAWALRIAMDESDARDVIIDLAPAEEACEFAASLLASYISQRRRDLRVRFHPGTVEQARVLAGYGLDRCELPPLRLDEVSAVSAEVRQPPRSPLDDAGAAA